MKRIGVGAHSIEAVSDYLVWVRVEYGIWVWRTKSEGLAKSDGRLSSMDRKAHCDEREEERVHWVRKQYHRVTFKGACVCV